MEPINAEPFDEGLWALVQSVTPLIRPWILLLQNSFILNSYLSDSQKQP